MKHLFETISAETFLESLPVTILPAENAQRRSPNSFSHLGAHSQADRQFYVGAMPFLGRLDAQQLKALAALARASNGGEIRLTPWQGIILPHIEAGQCDDLIRELHALELTTSPHASQSRLRACTGSAGCASALADTRDDAKRLALLLDNGTTAIHLTGCAKSCAALSTLPHTLLAHASGRYDVFLQDGAGSSRFGRLLATDMPLDAAARLLRA